LTAHKNKKHPVLPTIIPPQNIIVGDTPTSLPAPIIIPPQNIIVGDTTAIVPAPIEPVVGQPKVSDIETFFRPSERGSNDATNKLRERILLLLPNVPTAYLEDPTYGASWRTVRDSWEVVIGTIATQTAVPAYTSYELEAKGGRGFHYDLDISFYDGTSLVAKRKVEFKYGGRTIQELPQFLSLQVRKGLLPMSYDRFYYENYLDRYLATDAGITEPKPSLPDYLRYVSHTKYSVHRFFEQIKQRETECARTTKSRIVNESIRVYLELHGRTINIHEFMKKVKETQEDKIYVLWSNERFHTDRLTPSEMSMSTFDTIRNGNTIVLRSGSGTTTYHLLLRWRNHKGILNPAWQIKMKRG